MLLSTGITLLLDRVQDPGNLGTIDTDKPTGMECARLSARRTQPMYGVQEVVQSDNGDNIQGEISLHSLCRIL